MLIKSCFIALKSFRDGFSVISETVTEEENPNYYNLIKAWKERTGVPIIFNTSFNLGGEPLVETLTDALWTLQQSDIEYLYLPEYGKLVTIKN